MKQLALLTVVLFFFACNAQNTSPEEQYRQEVILADQAGVRSGDITVDTLMGNCDGSYRLTDTDWSEWNLELSERRISLCVPLCSSCLYEDFPSLVCACRSECDQAYVFKGIQYQQCLNRCGPTELPAYTEWGVIIAAYRGYENLTPLDRVQDYPNNFFEPYVNYGIRQAKNVNIFEGDCITIDERYLRDTLNALWNSDEKVCIMIDLTLYRQQEGTTETEACCNYRNYICNY